MGWGHLSHCVTQKPANTQSKRNRAISVAATIDNATANNQPKMFPSSKFYAFLSLLVSIFHHFRFECGAHFFLPFFCCCADQKSWKINFGFLFSLIVVVAFCLHSKRFGCLLLLLFCYFHCCFFFYVFLFYLISCFCFLFCSCRPLFSPIFYITTPYIISFAKHSHISAISLAHRLSLSLSIVYIHIYKI